MNDWEPYLDDRVISRQDGFVIIKPRDAEPGIPLCCSLCDTMLRNYDDEIAFLEFSCCHLCALAWAHSRRVEWKTGWRPSQAEIEASRASRPPLSLVLTLD